MANVMLIKDWHTGKVLRKVTIKTGSSITYGIENIRGIERIVIRKYFDNSIVQTIGIRGLGSITYQVI